ncbi:hypothetical protein P8452_40168 [Trifolium repens]|nr:hypothetical protein P8452_40168 [Trifolium repens]
MKASGNDVVIYYLPEVFKVVGIRIRVRLLYLIYGLGGSLASALFYQSIVTVDTSGALVGLARGTISKSFIEYCELHLPMRGDNFANLGWSIVGVPFGFVIFDQPLVNQVRQTTLLIITFLGLLIGVVLTLKDVSLSDHCSWCCYLDCISLPYWSCKHRVIDCGVNIEKKKKKKDDNLKT